MNTIGIARWRRASSLWRSWPVMPGMAISRIRQLVFPIASEERNSSADENAWTANPNSLSKSGSDSRTDSSSSTTDTSEGESIMTVRRTELKTKTWLLDQRWAPPRVGHDGAQSLSG